MLANIQTSIANILKENKSVKTELTELTAELTGTAGSVVNLRGEGGGGGLENERRGREFVGGSGAIVPRSFETLF